MDRLVIPIETDVGELMRIYLGSKMTAYAAIVAPIFVLGPILFAVYMLSAEVSGATVFLVLGFLSCTFLWGLCIKKNSNQLYSWGYFQNECVQVKKPFSEVYTMEYKKCRGCGIGYYIHGMLNSNVGTTVCYIFFSYDAFNESYRAHMNLWKPSQPYIKVEFCQKLYDYLVEVLPPKQSAMLRRDYAKYIA